MRPQYSGADLYLLELVHRYIYDPIGHRVGELSEDMRKRYFEIKWIVKAEADLLWPKYSEAGK